MYLIAPSFGPLDISQAQQVGSCHADSRSALHADSRAFLHAQHPFINGSPGAVFRCRWQLSQVLSDSNGDFAVIGICSADAASSSLVAALGSLLSGQQQQQPAAATAAPPGSLQGLRMHVSTPLNTFEQQHT